MWYYSANEYYKEKFGHKMYKLSLSGGFTCPNRDGTKGIGGCIFCSEGGSGDFSESLYDQAYKNAISNAKKRVSDKTGDDCGYIAYFQSFTSTYMPIEQLREKIDMPLNDDGISAISVGTRADCLGEDVIEVLKKANEIKPVYVEIGLQTIHDSTAKLINRCFDLQEYVDAVKRLREAGINVITHVIIGLPYETKEMMLETVKFVGKHTDGIKLQLLHVLKNTALEKLYLRGEFQVPDMDEYIDILCSCVELLPKNVVIHRLTGDAPKKLLVAPLWSADKKNVINSVRKTFVQRDIQQGRFSEQRS
ncbi:MAG: TIGR01212 family radical SAM protein [Clostridiales bacterium]|nr:TIGR01212 family radical SAM protein [Clostridiales bacterium]